MPSASSILPTACFFSFPVRCYLLFLPSCRLAASTSQHACRLPASFHRASFFLSSCGAALASAGTGPGRCHLRWNRLYCNSAVTVAILAQGTRRALAAKQAFCPFTSPMLQPMGLWPSWPPDSVLQHLIPSGASQAQVTCPVTFHFLSAAIFYSCHLAAWQQALHSMLVACLLASTVLLSSFLHAALASAGTGPGRCHLRWNGLYCNSAVTVAILAQGTQWALAAKQAFCPFTSPMLQPMGL